MLVECVNPGRLFVCLLKCCTVAGQPFFGLQRTNLLGSPLVAVSSLISTGQVCLSVLKERLDPISIAEEAYWLAGEEPKVADVCIFFSFDRNVSARAHRMLTCLLNVQIQGTEKCENSNWGLICSANAFPPLVRWAPSAVPMLSRPCVGHCTCFADARACMQSWWVRLTKRTPEPVLLKRPHAVLSEYRCSFLIVLSKHLLHRKCMRSGRPLLWSVCVGQLLRKVSTSFVGTPAAPATSHESKTYLEPPPPLQGSGTSVACLRADLTRARLVHQPPASTISGMPAAN